MCDLMCDDVVEHEGRGQNQPPRERDRARHRTRTPAAGSVANADLPRPRTDMPGKFPRAFLEHAPRFSFQKVDQAPGRVLGPSADANDVAFFDPDGRWAVT